VREACEGMNKVWGFVNKAWRIGRIAGISVELGSTWLVFCVLWTAACALVALPRVYPHWHPGAYWGAALVNTTLGLASLLLHELSHGVTAQRRRIPVARITMNVAYAATDLQRAPDRPWADLLIALAGPSVSLALALAFGGLFVCAQALRLAPLAAVGLFACALNLLWAVFNAIPIYPMDGGRALRAVLWAATGKRTEATHWAAITGCVMAGAVAVLGVVYLAAGRWADGLVLTLVGLLLLVIAGAGARMSRASQVRCT
jgi:Zn-dependent protease